MFSIIIVNWKLLELTKRCVNFIRDNSFYKHQIIVVHNESNGVMSTLNGVMHIHKKENVGLSKAANQGAKLATAEFICFIDNDIEVTRDWDTGLLMSHALTGSNWVCSTRAEPIPALTNISIKDYKKGKYNPERHGWYRQITNNPLLIPKKFWDKIGGFDEKFHTIGSDLGIAKRAYDNGVRDFVQTPYSLVVHRQSQSISRLKNLKKLRQERNEIFKELYGISKEDFHKLNKKGEKFNLINKE